MVLTLPKASFPSLWIVLVSSVSRHMKGTSWLPLLLIKIHKFIALLPPMFKMWALPCCIHAPGLVLAEPELEVQVVSSGRREGMELGWEPGAVAAQRSEVSPVKPTQVPLCYVCILHIWVQADREQFCLPEIPVPALRANWEDSHTCCRCFPSLSCFLSSRTKVALGLNSTVRGW